MSLAPIIVAVGARAPIIFEVTRGTDAKCNLLCKDENGDATDLTLYEVKFIASFRTSTGRQTIEKETADLTLDADVDQGIIHISLTPAETREMPLGKLTTWQCEATDEYGEQSTVGFGWFSVSEGHDNVD